MNNSPKEPLLTLFRALLSPGSRQLYTRKMSRFIALCFLLMVVGLGSGGCAKVHKIEGGSWSIEGVSGHIIIEPGQYHFGPKKARKKTMTSQYSNYACIYKFKVANRTNRYLVIKTMGEMLDKSGRRIDRVITSMYQELDPGQEEVVEGFFRVTKADAKKIAQFTVRLADYHIQ